MALFNANWTPGWMEQSDAYSEAGGNESRINYAGAFSGIDGLSHAVRQADGTYSLIRPGERGEYDYRATGQVGPDGKVQVSNWQKNELDSLGDTLKEAAMLAAVAMGGAGLAGYGPLSGLGSLTGATGAGTGVGTGAGFVGEGVASGIAGWDAAATAAGLDLGAAGAGLGITEAGLGGMGEPIGGAGNFGGTTGLSTGGSGSLAGAGLGGGSGGGLFGGGGSLLDWATRNPRVVSTIIGGLTGGAGGGGSGGGGGGSYTGPMPTITQGAWKPKVQQQSMPLIDVSTLMNRPRSGLFGG